jgi:hypothetical protein
VASASDDLEFFLYLKFSFDFDTLPFLIKKWFFSFDLQGDYGV